MFILLITFAFVHPHVFLLNLLDSGTNFGVTATVQIGTGVCHVISQTSVQILCAIPSGEILPNCFHVALHFGYFWICCLLFDFRLWIRFFTLHPIHPHHLLFHICKISVCSASISALTHLETIHLTSECSGSFSLCGCHVGCGFWIPPVDSRPFLCLLLICRFRYIFYSRLFSREDFFPRIVLLVHFYSTWSLFSILAFPFAVCNVWEETCLRFKPLFRCKILSGICFITIFLLFRYFHSSQISLFAQL